MKKLIWLFLLVFACTTVFHHDAMAQKRKKRSSTTDRYFDEGGFANRLWYGGNFNLGFAGSGETNQFVFGLSPMVGYKILGDIVSAGPRAGFTYNYIKGRGSDLAIHKVKPISWNLGIFARVKPITNLFAHFEYEYQNSKVVYIDQFGYLLVQNGEVVVDKEIRDNVYVGLGYTSGGLWAYEIMLLYNVNEPDDDLSLPFTFRFGITYKF